MGRIIVSVILLVLLTVLILLNLGPTAPINLFGAKFQNIPVVAVAMLSFALGVIYSLFLYIAQYLHRSSRDRLARRHKDVEERERKLAAAEDGPGDAAQGPQQGPEEGAAEGAAGQRSESALSRFFKLFR